MTFVISEAMPICWAEEMRRLKEIAPYFNVTSVTPPAFIWNNSEDKRINVINSYQYALTGLNDGLVIDFR